MTPNPVCYNGLSVPKAAIHIGPLSLGVTRKDYRADTAQRWRAGISPSTNVVLYSDTYSKGLDTQANSVPRIWWINATGTTAAQYKDKVREMVSRLPERSSLNYALLADWSATTAWLTASGKYGLINCNYPEYTFAEAYTGCQTVANLEAGYLGCSYGDSDQLRNLANPTSSVGFGTHAPAAFKVNDFTFAGNAKNLDTVPNFSSLGTEQGFTIGTGAIVQATATSAATYTDGFVIEGIFKFLTGANQCIFSLYDTVSNKSVFGLYYDTATQTISITDANQVVQYSMASGAAINPSIVTYITFAWKAGTLPTFRVGSAAPDNLILTGGTPIVWSNPTKVTLGALTNNGGGTWQRQLDSILSFKMHLASSSVSPQTMLPQIGDLNYPVAQALYSGL